MGYYHIAQICRNGHMVNDKADTNQARNKNFCPDCGAETITACPECGANIHGDYDVPGLAVIGAITPVDSFCLTAVLHIHGQKQHCLPLQD